MPKRTAPATLLREARQRAGLSQRALAQRARTAQSVVARIEQGRSSPSWETLTRLLAAAGFEIRPLLASKLQGRSHMLDHVADVLRMTPEQRLQEVKNVSEFLYRARRV